MNYEEMSDFEVNKSVSSLVDFGDLVVTVNDDNEVVYLCDKDGLFDMVPISHFDPCNNPSDAWPIIVENEINLETGYREGVVFWEACTYGDDEHGLTRSFNNSRSDNPLRAAMICFLKMKDAGNGN